MPKSTIRDGWGILLNASAHITDEKAIALLAQVRLANFETFSHEWALNRAVVVAGE